MIDVTARHVGFLVRELRALAEWDGFAMALFDWMGAHGYEAEAVRERWRRLADGQAHLLTSSMNDAILEGVYEPEDAESVGESDNGSLPFRRLLLAALDPGWRQS